MKHFLNTLLALSAAIFALTVSSCGEKITAPESPVLTIAGDTVEVAAEGGSYSVEYTVEHPVEGSVIRVSSEAGWLTFSDAHDGQKIVFTAAANDTGAEREAVVSVVYEYTSSELQSVEDEFVVRQPADSETPEDVPPFEIIIKLTNGSSVKFDIIPSDKSMPYIYFVMSEEEYNMFATEEELYENDIEYIRNLAETMSNLSFAEYLESMLTKGDKLDDYIMGLVPGETYVLYAYGLNNKAEKLSSVVDESFEADSARPVDITFDIAFEDVSAVSVNMVVDPSRDDQPYFYDFIRKQYLEDDGVDIVQYLEGYLEGQMCLYTEMLGLTYDAALALLAHWGRDSFLYDVLVPETEYIGAAVAIDAIGRLASEVFTKEITTPSVPQSDNDIKVSVTNITANTADYTITTTNNDEYRFALCLASEFEGMDNKDIALNLLNSVELNACNGNTSGQLTDMTADTEYFFIAFGTIQAWPTTEPVRVDFKTTAGGNSGEIEFEFEVGSITHYSAEVTIDATPDDAAYYFSLAPVSMTEEDLKAHFEDQIGSWMFGGDRLKYWEYVGLSKGHVVKTIGDLEDDTEYRPYAVGITEVTGEYATDFIFGETFKTNIHPSKLMSVNMIYDKYYDVDELAEAYPGEGFEKYVGQNLYCVPVTLEVTGDDVIQTYMNVYQEYDYTYYSDGDMTYVLLGDGYPERQINFIMKYNWPTQFLAIAEDSYGNYSKLFRETVTYRKSGVSPVEDFKKSGVQAVMSSDIKDVIAGISRRYESMPEYKVPASVVSSDKVTVTYRAQWEDKRMMPRHDRLAKGMDKEGVYLRSHFTRNK